MSRNKHGRHLIDSKDMFDVFSCLECGCVFLEKLDIGSEYYKKYYELGYYGSTPNDLLSKLVSLLSSFLTYEKQRLILGSVEKKNNIAILDVGCGTGNFLLQLDAEKFIKNGVEINQEGADRCRKSGLGVYNQNLMDIDFGEKKFDAVTLWHVLEHLEHPVGMLQKIRTILSDNGVLIFQVPNTGSLGFRYGREDWFHLDSPRHLILYNKRSVAKLCQLSGFQVVNTKSSFLDYPLDLFWSVSKSPLRYLVYPLYPAAKFFSKETLTFVCKKYQN